MVLLHRDQPVLAVERLSADIDDPASWKTTFTAPLWRPWYVVLWAEAAVLRDHPDTDTRLQRSIAATSENPIATTILHRARDIAHGNYDTLPTHTRALRRTRVCVPTTSHETLRQHNHALPPFVVDRPQGRSSRGYSSARR